MHAHFRLQELAGHTEYINSIAFQPDLEDKYLISTSDDFTCKIWSTEDGELLKTIPLKSPGYIPANQIIYTKHLVHFLSLLCRHVCQVQPDRTEQVSHSREIWSR